jgi:hypothetical protein
MSVQFGGYATNREFKGICILIFQQTISLCHTSHNYARYAWALDLYSFQINDLHSFADSMHGRKA